MTEEDQLYLCIGKNIKYYRRLYNLNKSKEKTLTQEKLAELAGVSVSMIGNLESENIIQGIGLYNLWKISRILNAPIQNFFKNVGTQ